MLLVAAIIATYAFLCPFLISYPNDVVSAGGFVIGVGVVPVFVIWFIKIFKKKKT